MLIGLVGTAAPFSPIRRMLSPGVGYVRVGWRGKGEKTRETLELTEIIKLSPEALAKARADALELEKRAYVYGRTPPAEPMTAARSQ